MSLENLRRNVQLRSYTDRTISNKWVLLPITYLMTMVALIAITIYLVFTTILRNLPEIIGATPGRTPDFNIPEFSRSFAPLFTLANYSWLIYLVFQVPFSYLLYIMIKRRNEHFSRQRTFVNELISILRSISLEKSPQAEGYLLVAERTAKQMNFEEGERSAILFAILNLVPLVNIIAFFYIFPALTKDLYIHERREDTCLDDMTRAMGQLGVTFSFARRGFIPDRSSAMYVFLTIMTLGVFCIYWLQVLIRDFNNHFKEHVILEDDLLNRLPPLFSVTP